MIIVKFIFGCSSMSFTFVILLERILNSRLKVKTLRYLLLLSHHKVSQPLKFGLGRVEHNGVPFLLAHGGLVVAVHQQGYLDRL